MTAYISFLAELVAYQSAHPEQRAGQAHFNVLHRLHPELANEIRGDRMLDPFHVDERVQAFREFVMARLVEAA
jgi:hypothetical protein